MKLIYLTLVFILFILIILPFVLTFLIKNIPNASQPSLEGTQGIYKDITVIQYFISELDNLSGFGMSIKNPYFRNKNAIDFKIFSENKTLLRTISLNGSNIVDGDFVRINFLPIPNSKGKKYYFEVTALENESAVSLEIFMTSQAEKWTGGLYVNGNRTAYNFSFITYHRISNPLLVITEIYIQMIKRLFADLAFGLFYSCLIMLLTYNLIIFKKKD